jgi:hypothetical protein
MASPLYLPSWGRRDRDVVVLVGHAVAAPVDDAAALHD